MDISLHRTQLCVRTNFSEEKDLIQIFSGMASEHLNYNDPIDFRVAGLQRKGHCDIWHVDTVLAASTDEAAPVMLLSDWMGSNHGYGCAVKAYVPGHDKDCADIGSLWMDEEGMEWTLLRLEEGEQLLFVSKNIGASKEDFNFANKIIGKLTYVKAGSNVLPITIQSQQGNVQLTRAIRHLHRDLYYWKDGERHCITGYHSQCDRVELVEEYEIINPATVVDALRKARPTEGYSCIQDLAIGEPILRYKIIFYIENDGTVICEFDHRLLQNVYWKTCMGIMYQEKCDVYNEGVWRYIPKLLPFTDTDGKVYDFSVPYNTSGEDFPHLYPLVKDTWACPDSPPDRQIDFIRGAESFAYGFVGGYLPLYDGVPSVRKDNIEEAATLIYTRKTYPSFMSRPQYEGSDLKSDNRTSHGVAYKKYFVPTDNACNYYTVSFEGVTYIYVDFWAKDEKSIEYSLPRKGQIHNIELAGDLDWSVKENILSVHGKSGYAVFALQLNK